MTTDTSIECAICGDSADDPRLISECMSCGRRFHLNPYSSEEHRDCGDALIGPSQGVEFWCQICLADLDAEFSANPPDPRAALDELASPGARAMRTAAAPIPPPAPAPAPPAPDAPPRRTRTRPARRYRRIDR